MMRSCSWCRAELSATARSDAKFCSKPCRQASHRFEKSSRRRQRNAPGRRLRFAYADPPYMGLSKTYYGNHPDFAGEVDHRALLQRLAADYDGWALSASAASLPALLRLVDELGLSDVVRVAAWVKGSVPHGAPAGPISSWEPVLYAGVREGTPRTDSLVHAARARLTDPGRVIGAKPAEFCRWLFELLGAGPGDVLDDLYPGSGGVARAWSIYASTDVEHDTSAPAPGDTFRPSEDEASREYFCDGSSESSDFST